MIDGVTHVLDRRIIAAATDGDRVFILFDYMSYPKDKPALNLAAFGRTGHLLWTVDRSPIDSPEACYVNIISVTPLVVGNFAGFDCAVDTTTGALLEATFTK